MMINKIIDYLDYLFPNPKCELEYNKDYELLLAIVMSAQTTDKRVNMVNRVLFGKYDSLEKLSKADIKDIESIIRPIGTYKKKAIFIKEIVNRLIKRLNLADEDDNVLEVENKLNYLFPKDSLSKIHHQLVFFGRYKCKSINPLCDDCKLKDMCKYYSMHSKSK